MQAWRVMQRGWPTQIWTWFPPSSALMAPPLETTVSIVHHSRRIGIDRPIGPYVDAFKQHLAERRYAAHTFCRYLAGITHFARWARSRRLRLHRIDEGAISRCVGPWHRTRSCGPCRRCNYAQTSPTQIAQTARRHRGRRYPHLSTCA